MMPAQDSIQLKGVLISCFLNKTKNRHVIKAQNSALCGWWRISIANIKMEIYRITAKDALSHCRFAMSGSESKISQRPIHTRLT